MGFQRFTAPATSVRVILHQPWRTEQFLNRADEFVDKRIELVARKSRLTKAEVKRIVKVLLIIRPWVHNFCVFGQEPKPTGLSGRFRGKGIQARANVFLH
jgi:hypothetical protein